MSLLISALPFISSREDWVSPWQVLQLTQTTDLLFNRLDKMNTICVSRYSIPIYHSLHTDGLQPVMSFSVILCLQVLPVVCLPSQQLQVSMGLVFVVKLTLSPYTCPPLYALYVYSLWFMMCAGPTVSVGLLTDLVYSSSQESLKSAQGKDAVWTLTHHILLNCARICNSGLYIMDFAMDFPQW